MLHRIVAGIMLLGAVTGCRNADTPKVVMAPGAESGGPTSGSDTVAVTPKPKEEGTAYLPAAASPVMVPALPAVGELGGFRPGLTADEEAAARRGYVEFFRVYGPSDGLGPYYNDVSCANCHFAPVPGGHGDLDHAAAGFVPPEKRPGPGGQPVDVVLGLPKKQIAGFPPIQPPAGSLLAVPGAVAPPLFGLGLLEAIPDEVIAAGCDATDRNKDGIRGRAIRMEGGVTRFGWRAHTKPVKDFVADALAREMGIISPFRLRDSTTHADADAIPDPEVDEARLNDLTAYVQALAPPPRQGDHPEGAAVFAAVGCAGCHRPSTAPGVPAYTDLCVHDLGPAFAHRAHEPDVSDAEWRTAPLWGLRFRTKYFHAHMASDLTSAITMHGGEAQPVRDRFLALPEAKRQALLAFLGTL